MQRFTSSLATYLVLSLFASMAIAGGRQRNLAAELEFLRSKGLDSLPEGYEIDHIIPRRCGGDDVPTNLQLLTVSDHRAKSARDRWKSCSEIVGEVVRATTTPGN